MKSECEKEEPEMARGKNISNVEERIKKTRMPGDAIFPRVHFGMANSPRMAFCARARIFTTRRVYFFFRPIFLALSLYSWRGSFFALFSTLHCVSLSTEALGRLC